MTAARFELGSIEEQTERMVELLVDADAVARLWAQDFTLFSEDPEEISNRMGWTDIAQWTLTHWSDLLDFGLELKDRVTHVVVMGMGGSSLFPEVLAHTFGKLDGFPRLVIIDSTHPDAVARALDSCPPDTTFHVASSKSGSTVETASQLEAFWARSQDPSLFAVITDPDSAFAELAESRGFCEIFLNDPEIGGRFAALSLFGMVPAALVGIDGESILTSALDMGDGLAPIGDESELNMAVRLGAAIAAAESEGRDKLAISIDPSMSTFGLWLEQLVAESLGKKGRGVVPIIGESSDVATIDSGRRLAVSIGSTPPVDPSVPHIHFTLDDPTDIGAHVLLWEFAVAFAGVCMEINPFDQPDVESAKVAARQALQNPSGPSPAITPIGEALSAIAEGDHVALCAFVDPTREHHKELDGIRSTLSASAGAVVTLEIGPRFLHSTGQLHKGGPDNIVVLQVVEGAEHDVAIPGESFTFGDLMHAQADGDLAALRDAGKRCFRVSLPELAALSS